MPLHVEVKTMHLDKVLGHGGAQLGRSDSFPRLRAQEEINPRMYSWNKAWVGPGGLRQTGTHRSFNFPFSSSYNDLKRTNIVGSIFKGEFKGETESLKVWGG